MLTIFLKHDETRSLAELNAQLEKQGFYKAFPPPGVEVVSWNIVMGIGQVVTLRLPASRLREINRFLETTAWGESRNDIERASSSRLRSSRYHRGMPEGIGISGRVSVGVEGIEAVVFCADINDIVGCSP